MRSLGYEPIAEAAARAGVTEETIRTWIRNGDVEGLEVAGALWIEKASLDPKIPSRPKPEPAAEEPGGPVTASPDKTEPPPTPKPERPTEPSPAKSELPPDASWVAAEKQAAEKSAEKSTPPKLSGPIKGELIDPGIRNVTTKRDHVGARIGPHIINRDWFLGITPSFGFHLDDLKLAFQAPLNVLVHRGGTESLENGGLRDEDWDEAADFARVIRYISYGNKEDRLFLSIDSFSPSTIGHGELMRFYQGNIDVDRSMTGASFDAYNDYGGFQLKLNDVTFENQIVGALAFLKPLGFLDEAIPKSLSLGVEYVADFNAPQCVRKSANDPACVAGSGHRAGPDPFTGRSRDDTFVRTDPELGRPLVDVTSVQAIGFSGEMRVQSGERSNTKAYLTFHQFFGEGNGAAGGLIARFTTGKETFTTFRLRGEYRTFTDGYLPSYFDALYEVTKYQFVQSSSPYQVTPTKYQAVFGDPDHGFAEPSEERKHGFRFEGALAFYDDEETKRAAFGLGLEDSTGADDTNFYAHLELPIAPGIEGFGTFIAQNAADFGDVFGRGLEGSVILAGARIQLLPILFAHVTYSHNFQIVRGAGHELHLGNERIVNESGSASRYFGSDRIFENVESLFIELELGYEWREKDEDEAEGGKTDAK